MKIMNACIAAAALFAAGCASYSWKASVPEDMRTVDVPVFRNESSVTELGGEMSAQVARELQREGTFTLSTEPAIEVQGVVKSVTTMSRGLDRMNATRNGEYVMTAVVEVSLVDKKAGRTLFDACRYVSRTTIYADFDLVGAERAAAGRLAEQIARQVVDDMLHRDWTKGDGK